MTADHTAPRIYLAGPEVFLPDPLAAGEALKAICRSLGLVGLFPLDNALPPLDGESLPAFANRIRLANIGLIRSAQAVVANVTPFRGPCADDGTAYEIGFATALGLPVFLYSAEGGSLLERTRRRLPLTADGSDWRDSEGMAVEDFGLPVNLMLIDPDQGAVFNSAESALQAASCHFSQSEPESQ
jgi:nucleoside 2-deoxyribosyltransferase